MTDAEYTAMHVDVRNNPAWRVDVEERYRAFLAAKIDNLRGFLPAVLVSEMEGDNARLFPLNNPELAECRMRLEATS